MPQQQSKEKREQMAAKSRPQKAPAQKSPPQKAPAQKSPEAIIATPKPAAGPVPTTAQPNRSGLGDLAKANKAAKAAHTAPPPTSNDATVAAQRAKEKKNR